MQQDIHLHILSKYTAQSLNIKYFVSVPCVRGHLFFRNMRSECMQCKLELNTIWREGNREKHNASNRNRDPLSDFKYRQRHKALIKERTARYRKDNYGRLTENARNRRARSKGAEGSHSKEDVLRILELQKERCATCTKKLVVAGPGRYHVDHIYPLARGGSNFPSNLQMLCPKCNLKKNAKDPIIWQQIHGKLL